MIDCQGNGRSRGSRIKIRETRGNEWSANLGSEAQRAVAVELEEAVEGRGTSMMRSCAGFKVSGASLMRLSAASPRLMVALDAAFPLQVDRVVPPRHFQDQPVHLVNSPGQVTIERHSQIGSLSYLIALVMDRLCPEMAGGVQGTSQGCKQSRLQVTRDHLLTTMTQGGAANGIGRRSGGVEGGPRILGFQTTSPPKRSISNRVVWIVACLRRLALEAVAAYLM